MLRPVIDAVLVGVNEPLEFSVSVREPVEDNRPDTRAENQNLVPNN
jgi:hypothetical protein